MPRILFEKTDNAIWMSHLDLMRLFQRAFRRAGLHLTHTQGFNPRPSVSIALPLSVGVKSRCELLDFDLEGDTVSIVQIKDKLNAALVHGVKVLDVYDNGRKLKELSHLRCRIHLEFKKVSAQVAKASVMQLLSEDTLIVPKKTKNGMQEQDIIPLIREFSIRQDKSKLIVDAIICCQNPSLNPMQIPAAIALYLPQLQLTHSNYERLEILDDQNNVFR